MGIVSAGLGLASSIFGKSSANKAADTANQGFSWLANNNLVKDTMGTGATANKYIAQLLGLQGGDAGEAAFDRFKESTGYTQRLEAGMDAIEGSQAAAGLLNSGATAKALTSYGQDLASEEFSNYLNNLNNQRSTGLSSAFSVGQAGSGSGATAAAYKRQGDEDVMAGVGGLISGLAGFG